MFTGIIEKVGDVIAWHRNDQEGKVLIATGFADLALGESVAVDGVCLTVAKVQTEGLALFHVSPETLRLTRFASLARHSHVNLERALRLGDRLSGHWVQGHVDGTARIVEVKPDGECYSLAIVLPQKFLPYCIEKGSIAVNGVSLTINSIDRQGLATIQLVPHTWNHTNFSSLRATDLVNIEVDLLAKYVEQQCRTWNAPLNN